MTALAERLAGVTVRIASSVLGGVLAAFLATPIRTAQAYPTVDPTNQQTLPTGAPQGTELPQTDINALQNQLQLVNPPPPPGTEAWTIVPRLTMQELLTDNVFEVTSPRRFDAISVISPGISVLTDTRRLQLNLDYQPDLLLHAVEGPLNVMTQHLNLTGLVTVVPDLAFIDVRALSGVQSSLGGGIPGSGNIGVGNAGLATAPATQSGTNPFNEVQTSSAGISPYLLHTFGDYGTGKLGVSVDASHYSNITGFAANPFGSSGSNAQSLLATEQIAQFTTGEFLGRFQSAFSADFLQSRTNASTGIAIPVVTPQGTVTSASATSFTSTRNTIQDTVTYAVNRWLALLGAIGEQHIEYSHNVGPEVSGITWKGGFTLTPSEDSAVTLTYGRYNGTDAFQANGHIAFTARTTLAFDYSNTVGTQLESLQNQLNNSVVGPTGQLINAQTGGPNFVATNLTGVQTGVFRYNTLNVSLRTVWPRDELDTYATWSLQTNLTPGNVQTTQFIDPTTGNIVTLSQPVSGTGQQIDVKTANLLWTHALTEDMLLTSAASYAFTHRSVSLGNDSAVAAGVTLRYLLSPKTTVSAQYSFYDRVSKIPGYSLYENTLLVGFTRTF